MIYHNYIFFTSNPAFHILSAKTQKEYTKEFLTALSSDKNVIVTSYATVGLKANTTILLWFQANTIESIQNLLNKLMHTHLGGNLNITHTLVGMTRQTQYSHRTVEEDTTRKGGAYLIIYPFTKTKEWYMLDFDTRKKLMSGHISIGKKHGTITQLLLYSYGIDDNEFIVSYETNDLSAFQTLVIELRSDNVRMYTLTDTPIFTCIYKLPAEVMKFL